MALFEKQPKIDYFGLELSLCGFFCGKLHIFPRWLCYCINMYICINTVYQISFNLSLYTLSY